MGDAFEMELDEASVLDSILVDKMELEPNVAEFTWGSAARRLDTAASSKGSMEPCLPVDGALAMELDMPVCVKNLGSDLDAKFAKDGVWLQYAGVVKHCLSQSVSFCVVEAKLGTPLLRRTRNMLELVYASRHEEWEAEQILINALQSNGFQYSVYDVFCRLLYAAQVIRETAPAGNLLQFIEFFAGRAGHARYLSRMGCATQAFDLRIDPCHDINSDSGFNLYLVACCSTLVSSIAWSGLVCTSWVWIGRSQTGRNAKHPLGNEHKTMVAQGNGHMRRQVILSMLWELLGNEQVIEQPLSSIVDRVPLFCEMLRVCRLQRMTTWLGAFGAPTPKPLHLWSTCGFTDDLRRNRPCARLGLLSTTVWDDGKRKRVTGKRDELQQSSAYPDEFCKASSALIYQRFGCKTTRSWKS